MREQPMASEQRTSRLHLHIPHESATLIARAAMVTQQSVSEFIISAATERAKRVLKQK
jgi:uncharacterized protein (DUF1778 family)